MNASKISLCMQWSWFGIIMLLNENRARAHSAHHCNSLCVMGVWGWLKFSLLYVYDRKMLSQNIHLYEFHFIIVIINIQNNFLAELHSYVLCWQVGRFTLLRRIMRMRWDNHPGVYMCVCMCRQWKMNETHKQVY